MDAFLDNARLETTRPGLAGALDAARAAAEAAGRVVIEAIADGVALTDEQLADPSGAPGSWREVRFTSVAPGTLVAAALADAADALGAVREAQRRAAELVMAGRSREASEPLMEAVRTWAAVRSAVERGAALLNTPAQRLVCAGDESRYERGSVALASQLAEVKRSLGDEDWPALADTLAYELDATAEDWTAMLRGASAALTGGSCGPSCRCSGGDPGGAP